MADWDFEDVFGSAIWQAIRRGFAFFLTIWVGCFIGVLSLILSETTSHLIEFDFSQALDSLYSIPYGFAVAPLFPFISAWGLIYVVAVLSLLVMFIRIEDPIKGVLVCAAVFALTALLGYLSEITLLEKILSFFYLLILYGMVGAMVWYYNAWQCSRAAGHFETIRAENTQRRKFIKNSFGTSAPDQREMGPPPSDH